MNNKNNLPSDDYQESSSDVEEEAQKDFRKNKNNGEKQANLSVSQSFVEKKQSK